MMSVLAQQGEDLSISLWRDPIRFLQEVTFAFPQRLWFLLGILLLAVLYVISQFRRRSYAIRFTNVELLDKIAPDRVSWRRHIPPILGLLGLALGVVAFADPQQVVSVASERATVIMAIDTSLSMQATDVTPSRIDGAKIAAAEFVDQVPPEINLGLVSFNGIATIRNPPSTNRAAVKAAISDLELGPATAIGEAIFASLQAIQDILPDETGATPPARIVLMSDGKTTVGREDAAAVEAARQAGIPISTIAFGTEFGTIILPENPNEILSVAVDYVALSAIADGSGGQFFAADSTEELKQVYADIGSAVGFTEETQSVASTFVGSALVLLAGAWLLGMAWRVTLPF